MEYADDFELDDASDDDAVASAAPRVTHSIGPLVPTPSSVVTAGANVPSKEGVVPTSSNVLSQLDSLLGMVNDSDSDSIFGDTTKQQDESPKKEEGKNENEIQAFTFSSDEAGSMGGTDGGCGAKRDSDDLGKDPVASRYNTEPAEVMSPHMNVLSQVTDMIPRNNSGDDHSETGLATKARKSSVNGRSSGEPDTNKDPTSASAAEPIIRPSENIHPSGISVSSGAGVSSGTGASANKEAEVGSALRVVGGQGYVGTGHRLAKEAAGAPDDPLDKILGMLPADSETESSQDRVRRRVAPVSETTSHRRSGARGPSSSRRDGSHKMEGPTPSVSEYRQVGADPSATDAAPFVSGADAVPFSEQGKFQVGTAPSTRSIANKWSGGHALALRYGSTGSLLRTKIPKQTLFRK